MQQNIHLKLYKIKILYPIKSLVFINIIKKPRSKNKFLKFSKNYVDNSIWQPEEIENNKNQNKTLKKFNKKYATDY